MKESNRTGFYDCRQLSGFCLQISMLLSAAIPLDEGLRIIAEDAAGKEEKELLNRIADDVELGDPFFAALEKTECFPDYMVKMAKLGQESGTLEQIMSSLSGYYDKEFRLRKAIKGAVTYPAMLIVMLLAVLFVLFAKVMPVFENVYEQLGAAMPPVAKQAIRVGAWFSGIGLFVSFLILLLVIATFLASMRGRRMPVASSIIRLSKKTKVAEEIAKMRFASTLSLTLSSGMEMEKGLKIAGELVDNEKVAGKIAECAESLENGTDYYDALKATEMFSGFHIQMIKVGSRSGHLDSVMKQIADDYEETANQSIEQMVAKFEPTVVAVLAVVVGLVLLSVMLPLVGILSSIA